ncbi:MAG: MFS transporter [Francisellaceae bacterium]
MAIEEVFKLSPLSMLPLAALIVPIVGYFSDCFGRKSIMLIVSFFCIVGCLWTLTAAESIPVFAISYFLISASFSLWPLAMASFSDRLPRKSLVVWLGLVIMANFGVRMLFAQSTLTEQLFAVPMVTFERYFCIELILLAVVLLLLLIFFKEPEGRRDRFKNNVLHVYLLLIRFSMHKYFLALLFRLLAYSGLIVLFEMLLGNMQERLYYQGLENKAIYGIAAACIIIIVVGKCVYNKVSWLLIEKVFVLLALLIGTVMLVMNAMEVVEPSLRDMESGTRGRVDPGSLAL